MTMTLKRAKEIAGRVGATISQINEQEFRIRLGVTSIGPEGSSSFPVFFAPDPQRAATVALIETGRAAMTLAGQAKQTYAESEVLF